MPIQGVTICAAENDIAIRSAKDIVKASFTKKNVVPNTTVQLVRVIAAKQHVRPGSTEEPVGTAAATKDVRA